VDATEDQRRKIAHKRKVQGLEENEKLLFRLVETLAEALGGSSDTHIKGLVRLVRDKASLEEIKVFMEHADSVSNDNNTDAAITLMGHNAINYKASDSDTMDESTDGSLANLPPNFQENGSYARLDIANLIHSNESMKATEAFIGSILKSSRSPTPEPAGSAQ
jgi:hypothetical protein